jgi:hypothetical protein
MQARDFFDEPPATPVPHERAQREAAPREEAEAPRRERSQPRDPAPQQAEAPAPVSVYSSGNPPQVVFHAVSEHDAAAADESHRPVRRRRQGDPEATPQPTALQLVETQVEVAPPVVLEDELPRRTRPRRRRGSAEASEPLKLVETQPGAEGARPDSQP